MAEKLFYCETCDVHLTGPQPVMQHYSGSKHKKKEALKSAQSSSTLFSAATDRSTGMNYSTVALVSDLGRRADLPDLPGSTSACSSELTKSESFLKAAETAPRYNVVMVPPLNPTLPPVAVTMTEDVLPQSEYEFDGSSGSCCVCGVQLTSQQHADQHLTGQKHLKAKKKWEMRREQLQMTVSGLSPSMKSKPIAMCQPLVCESPAKYCVSSVSAAKHSSDRPNPMMYSGPATTKSVNVDGMQWFSCDVCSIKMNTVEMLELHRRSPAHLKKVEQQQQQQQCGSVAGDNTVWQLCPVCHKKLNSPAQLEIHMNSHSRPSTTVNQAAHAEGKVVQVVAAAGTQWHHCDVCNKYMNTALELQHHQQSPAHQKKAAPSDVFGDNTAWQICPLCAKRLNSVKQLDIHIKSHGLPTGLLLNDLPMNTMATETQITSSNSGAVFRNFNTTSLAAETSCSLMEFSQKVEVDVPNLLMLAHQVRLQEGISQEVVDTNSLDLSHDDTSQTSLQNLGSQTASSGEINADIVADDKATGDDKNCASLKEFSQKVDVTNLLMLVNQAKLQEGISQETVKINSLDLSRNDSQTTSNDEINSAVVADDVATGGDDKNGASVSVNQPTFGCAEDDNVSSPATSQADVDIPSLAAAAGDDADEKLITDDDLVTTGCCTSVGCLFHCELCDVHLNSDDSRTMHLTGTKHSSCRQKAEEAMPAEHNPFGPSFRYFCQLCNVPFNTLRDKIQHDQGQQHTSKSVRCLQAPERLLPHVVVPADVNEVNRMPDSLVTSKPRLYQEELYYKALLADSICFLPTGRCPESVSCCVIAESYISELVLLN